MDEIEAQDLLELSREARWAFPSSSGTPVRGDEPWLQGLVAEQERLGAAAAVLDPVDATELAANVWRLWMLSRDVDGGRLFLAEALPRDGGRSRDRALALYGDGLFAFWQGAIDESRACSEASLECARKSGDAEALALANLGLSRAALSDGDAAAARAFALEARRHAHEVGEPLGQAPLHLHAQSIRMLGDYDEAAVLFRENLELNRRVGDLGMIGVELHNLGWVELHRGNVGEVGRLFGELAHREAGGDPYTLALGRLNEAALAYAHGERDEARELLSRVDAELRETGTELAPDDQFELDWLRQRLTA